MGKLDMNDVNCLVELHTHIDGCISPKSARELAELSGIELPESEEKLKELLVVPEDCHDLNEYLERYELPISLLQTPEALEACMYNLCEELADDGVAYAELRYAPQLHCQRDMTQEDAVVSLLKGAKKSSLNVQVILCCMRADDNQEENLETVRLTKKYLGKGVCSTDLAGAEALFPTKNYGYIFEEAQKLGVPYTIHAGEADGPESVKSALDFGTKRLGHGIRSLEDPELAQWIADNQIHCEVCPTSNIRTCIFPSLEDYPIRTLLKMGINFSINTDGTSVANTTLRKEYQHMVDIFDLSKEEVQHILLNAINASFADEETKKNIIEKIQQM